MRPRHDDQEGVRGGTARAGGSAGPLFERDAPSKPDGRGPNLEALLVTWARTAGETGFTSTEAFELYQTRRNPEDPRHTADVFSVTVTTLVKAGRLVATERARNGRRVVVAPAPASLGSVIVCTRRPAGATVHRTPGTGGAADNWKPEVPIDSALLAKCSGCASPMGWIERAEGGKSHPVEVRGYVGVHSPKGETGVGPQRTGWTLSGHVVRIRRDDQAPKLARVVVFESHFGHCPKAHRFGRRTS